MVLEKATSIYVTTVSELIVSKQKILSVTLKDCRIDTFHAGGKGGQNQNTRDSGVRITHPPSGAVGESREFRTQLQNKKSAFKKMANHPKMNIWIHQQTHVTIDIEAEVELAMTASNLVIEVKENGEWIKE